MSVQRRIGAAAVEVGVSADTMVRDKPPATDLVDAQEVARVLQVPVSAIEQHARTGRIPASKVGRRWRFNVPQVVAALSGGPT